MRYHFSHWVNLLGSALSIVVYEINMFGDAVRDLLDPRLRGGAGRYGGRKPKRSFSLQLSTVKQWSNGIKFEKLRINGE